MSGQRKAKFEYFCVADCLSKMERTSSDVEYILNNEPARKAFKSLE